MSHIARRYAFGLLICISSLSFEKTAQAHVFFQADSLEKECLVWIVYYDGAAANEPHDGLAAIAQAVVNRQRLAEQSEKMKRKFGGTNYCALMMARKQFSFWLMSFGLRDLCQPVVMSKLVPGATHRKKAGGTVRVVTRALPHGAALERALAATNEVLEGVWQPAADVLKAIAERLSYYMNAAYSGKNVCPFRSEFMFAGKFPGSAHELYVLPTPGEQARLTAGHKKHPCMRVPASPEENP